MDPKRDDYAAGKRVGARVAALPGHEGNIIMIEVREKDGVRTMWTADGLEVVEDETGQPWIPSTGQQLSW